MTFKMKNMSYWKRKNALPGINHESDKNMPDGRSKSSPFQKKMGPYKPFDVDEEIEKGQQQYPGHGNPKTPSTMYKADGTKVNTSNIGEGELSRDKTDSKGKYTLYAPEGEKSIKYYYKKPK